MSALRYSGEIRIRVTYRDARRDDVYIDGTPRNPNGSYRCYLRGPVGARATIIIGAPTFLPHGVDSPKAFDDAARAALAFAEAEADEAQRAGGDYESWGNRCAWVSDLSDRHVGRTEAHAWPMLRRRLLP